MIFRYLSELPHAAVYLFTHALYDFSHRLYLVALKSDEHLAPARQPRWVVGGEDTFDGVEGWWDSRYTRLRFMFYTYDEKHYLSLMFLSHALASYLLRAVGL